jgi:hypothetical protein
MGINQFKPHLLILSEDDGYKDIANGFVKHFAIVSHTVQIEKPFGGWLKLLEGFSQEYEQSVRTYPHRHVLLLLDLDGEFERTSRVLKQIPDDIRARVFFLCGLNNVERIKSGFGSGFSEDIGEQLAHSCYEDTHANEDTPWSCPQLRHNRGELDRLAAAVRPFIF